MYALHVCVINVSVRASLEMLEVCVCVCVHVVRCVCVNVRYMSVNAGVRGMCMC